MPSGGDGEGGNGGKGPAGGRLAAAVTLLAALALTAVHFLAGADFSATAVVAPERPALAEPPARPAAAPTRSFVETAAPAALPVAAPPPTPRADRLDIAPPTAAAAPPAPAGERPTVIAAAPAATDPRVPIPRPRPGPPRVAAAASPGAPAPAASGDGAVGACFTALAGKATFEPSLPVSRGACTIVAPVSLGGVGAAASAVKLQPAATVGCTLAAAFADWVSKVVQPAAMAELGVPVTAIRVVDSYSCRPVDNLTGAKLSQHAFGNAIDVGAFQVGKRWIVVGGKGDAHDAAFFAAVRKGACSYFTTVLGPGSDAFHTDNLHLDLARHNASGTYRICQ